MKQHGKMIIDGKCKWLWCIFSLHLDLLSILMFMFGLQSASLVASNLFNQLWGRVAGSRSVSAFPEWGEVTSGFLRGDGQVLLCYCGGHKTSSMAALLVNVWNLICWARVPMRGNINPSQVSFPIMPLSLSESLVSTHFLPLCSLPVRFYVKRI